jgi:hypothetical protein
VKTLESKETRAQRRKTVTHNSVFAAHRLQCRMTNREIDIRHFVFLLTADCTENQLGYKMAKWINRIEVVNSFKHIGKGQGG